MRERAYTTCFKIGIKWLYKHIQFSRKVCLSVKTDPPISKGGSRHERRNIVFEHQFQTKKQFTGKDGEQSFINWLKHQGINTEDFPFRVKTDRKDRKGFDMWLNVVSWGFYQGSDWRWYHFISYRSSDGRYTCAYHWDSDEQGKPCGTPRVHEWIN